MDGRRTDFIYTTTYLHLLIKCLQFKGHLRTLFLAVGGTYFTWLVCLLTQKLQYKNNTIVHRITDTVPNEITEITLSTPSQKVFTIMRSFIYRTHFLL